MTRSAKIESIRFSGEEHRGAKRYWLGTQRSIAPEETLERIRPCFPTAGITRLANITGLDRVGIPVTLAIRPNGKTLSNSTGKGFTMEAAMASGAMEAIELFHAEECVLPSFRLPYKELSQDYGHVAVEDLQLIKHAPFSENWPYLWSLGWDLVSQGKVAVPVSLINMGMGSENIHELFSFQITSNGLASGNTFLEALNAALFEVIERDAVTCHKVRWDQTGKPPPVVAQDTIEHPLVRQLLDRLTNVGMGAIIFDCTTDTDVPVYMAFLVDKVWRNIGVFKGYGSHLDPEVAMIRALTEAVQGRAVYIAGSRDDFFRHNEVRLHHDVNEYAAQRLLTDFVPSVNGGERTSEATPTFEGDTLLAVQKLIRAGLDRVIVFDLSRPDFPIHVVKVVVPGLEGYMFDFYTPGRRARVFSNGEES